MGGFPPLKIDNDHEKALINPLAHIFIMSYKLTLGPLDVHVPSTRFKVSEASNDYSLFS